MEGGIVDGEKGRSEKLEALVAGKKGEDGGT